MSAPAAPRPAPFPVPTPATRAPGSVALPDWAPDADDRGALDIAPVVLRKIVEHATDLVPGTLHRERRVAGLEVGDSGPRARISATGDAVDVRLEVTCVYPAPVRETVAAVRAMVAAELERLAGYRVRSLAVTVSGLRRPTAPVQPRIR
ncbi:Asp23/Gls24 family envelope stress response protein [Pseudonocardia sp. RS11V-5]|uniref:Asp23/Gls24 family envelope stress response protein n=1 Tax=Pseudonocardia terrae TaxID=2905831 RepID=UPI001E325B56|nr:Asp23/Gls24 family envelope stress response protein [Pseudonocardia terrae]MCE3555277.1 Asp23/Gls24 family envelope stress response protein [Pseudonocardia terrae]